MINTGLFLSILLHLLPVLYAITLFDYILVFVTNEAVVRKLARPLLIFSVVCNVVYLLVYTVYFEHIPMVNVYQVMGAVGFAVAAIYLWVETRTRTLYSGPFILGLVLVFQIINTVFPKLDREVPEILRSMLFSAHVSAAVLGYSAFAVSAVYGLMYLIQYQAIRAKRFGLAFRRLPSLDILDRMNFYSVRAGLVFLTVAIVIGMIWSARIFGHVKIDPKVMVAVLTWAVYLLALLGRQFTGWKGPRLAFSSVLGFVFILFSVFAVNFFFTKFHVFVS